MPNGFGNIEIPIYSDIQELKVRINILENWKSRASKDINDILKGHKNYTETYKFHGQLLKYIDRQLLKPIRDEVSSFEKRVNSTINDFKKSINEEINKFKTEVNNQISSIQSLVNRYRNELDSKITSRYRELTNKIGTISKLNNKAIKFTYTDPTTGVSTTYSFTILTSVSNLSDFLDKTISSVNSAFQKVADVVKGQLSNVIATAKSYAESTAQTLIQPIENTLNASKDLTIGSSSLLEYYSMKFGILSTSVKNSTHKNYLIDMRGITLKDLISTDQNVFQLRDIVYKISDAMLDYIYAYDKVLYNWFNCYFGKIKTKITAINDNIEKLRVKFVSLKGQFYALYQKYYNSSTPSDISTVYGKLLQIGDVYQNIKSNFLNLRNKLYNSSNIYHLSYKFDKLKEYFNTIASYNLSLVKSMISANKRDQVSSISYSQLFGFIARYAINLSRLMAYYIDDNYNAYYCKFKCYDALTDTTNYYTTVSEVIEWHLSKARSHIIWATSNEQPLAWDNDLKCAFWHIQEIGYLIDAVARNENLSHYRYATIESGKTSYVKIVQYNKNGTWYSLPSDAVVKAVPYGLVLTMRQLELIRRMYVNIRNMMDQISGMIKTDIRSYLYSIATNLNTLDTRFGELAGIFKDIATKTYDIYATFSDMVKEEANHPFYDLKASFNGLVSVLENFANYTKPKTQFSNTCRVE